MEGVTATLYEELIDRNQNILIAGCSGSGKSTFMNGLINAILYRDNAEHLMILVDPKSVEFGPFSETTHCIKFASSQEEVKNALLFTQGIIQARKEEMRKRHLRMYDGGTVHLLIDEMAEITLGGKEITNLLQSICQIGRATKVQVTCATQCPLATVIPTRIKVNFPVIVGLHTATKAQSRNILEVPGCEELPMVGQSLILYPGEGVKKTKVPKIPEEWLERIAEFRYEEKY